MQPRIPLIIIFDDENPAFLAEVRRELLAVGFENASTEDVLTKGPLQVRLSSTSYEADQEIYRTYRVMFGGTDYTPKDMARLADSRANKEIRKVSLKDNKAVTDRAAGSRPEAETEIAAPSHLVIA